MLQDQSIKELERQIDHIKLQHRLGKIPTQKARFHIKELEIELGIIVDRLPRYERSIYRIKKEYGKDF